MIILICPERILRFDIYIRWTLYFMQLSHSSRWIVCVFAFINTIIYLQAHSMSSINQSNEYWSIYECMCVYLCQNDYYLLAWFYVKFKFILKRICPKQLNSILHIGHKMQHRLSHRESVRNENFIKLKILFTFYNSTP